MRDMKVLHVEDNVYKHMNVLKQLKDMRISDVTWAQSFEEGKAKLEEGHYDLMITDMSFPIRFGEVENDDAGDMMIDLAHRIHPDMPIILVTSFRMKKDGILGVVHYDPDELWENDLRDLVRMEDR